MAFLIDDILLAPLKGIVWIARNLKGQAEKEYFSESRVKEELLGLQMQLDEGKISEEEYKKQEEKLLQRLEEIRKYEEEKINEGV